MYISILSYPLVTIGLYTRVFDTLNPLPDDLNLPLSKPRAFADNKFNMAEMVQRVRASDLRCARATGARFQNKRPRWPGSLT